jgi:hypothetical protein
LNLSSEKLVSKFAASNSQLVPLRRGWKSEEAHEKWRSRREDEVAEGFRNFPIGLDSILSDVLEECGQRVYRAEGLDGDDVVGMYKLNPVDTHIA